MKHSINNIAKIREDMSILRHDRHIFYKEIFKKFAKHNKNKYSIVEHAIDLDISSFHVDGLIKEFKDKLEKYHNIYDILVDKGGANEEDRFSFINAMLDKNKCYQWRFCGKLGFGGKYFTQLNEVSAYEEDCNSEVLILIHEINNDLKSYE